MSSKSTKQSIITILLFFALLSLVILPVQGKVLTKVTLDLFWQHQFEFAGFYAAVEQGYFEQAGIKVEFNELDGADDFVHRVLTGKAQFGIAGVDLLKSYHNGGDVKLLASYFKRSPMTLITQPEITTLKQLTGKSVIGANKTWLQGGIRQMLNYYRVDPKSILSVAAENRYEVFKNKKVAGLIGYISNEPYELNRLKIPYRIYDPNQYANVFLDFNLFTSTQFARSNPVLVAKFTEAANLGWHYALSHPEKIIELIKNRYNSQNKTTSALKFEADEISKLIMRDLYEIGSIDKNQLKVISESLLVNQVVNKLRNIEGLLLSDHVLAIPSLENSNKLTSSGTFKKHRVSNPAHLKLWIELTQDEKQYLNAHPRLTVQNEDNYPPFNFIKQGKPSGYSIDYLTLLAGVLNTQFDYVSGFSWTENLTMLKDNRLDMMVNIVATPKREQFASFSAPIAKSLLSFTVKKDRVKQFTSLEQFVGKRIAVIKNFYQEEMLQLFYPEIELVLVDTVLEGLTAVSNDLADGYVDIIGVSNFFITQYYLHHLVAVVIADNPHFPTIEYGIATNKKNRLLTSILNKAIKLVPEAEAMAISRKWFSNKININESDVLQLTSKEQEYLRQHPVISVQNELNFPPFNFISGGKAAGYSIDFINLVASKLGISVQFIQDESWNSYLERLKNKKLDVMINIIATEELREFAIFTTPFTDTSHLVVTRKGELNNISDLRSLAKKRIALVSGFAISVRIQKNLPGASFIEVLDSQQALEAVAGGRADIHFAIGAVASYLIEKNFMANLEMIAVPATPSETVFQITPLSMATHKDNPILLSLLQKAIDSIPERELISLRKQWIGLEKQVLPQVPLTAQEQYYLNKKRTLKVMIKDFPPFSFIHNDITQGFSIDLMTIIGQMLNIQMEFIQKSWSVHLKQLINREVDVLLNVINTEEGRNVSRFTQPYIDARDVFVLRTNMPQIEARFSSFNDRTLTVIKGYGLTHYIQENYSKIKLLEVNSVKEALFAVSEGRADGHIANEIVANYFIQKSFISNLQTVPVMESEILVNTTLSMAVNNKNRLLRSILDKTLLVIPEEKLIALRKKWFSQLSGSSKNTISTTRKQKEWLINHDLQTLYLPELGLPLSHKTEHGYQGIIPDFVNYFKQQLAVDWADIIDKPTNPHQDPSTNSDIIIADSQDEKLKGNYLFSAPILIMPVVAVSGEPRLSYVDNLSKLTPKITGVLQNAGYLAQIKKNYPNLHLVYFDTMSAAVMAVNRGDVDILLCPLAHCSYKMNELGTNQLRIINQTDINEKLHFAVRKDWPELVEIINSVLASMSPQLKNSIYQRWNSREDVLIKMDYSLIGYLLIVALLIISLVIAWNRKISKYAQKIATAHEELKNTQQQLMQSEKMASLGTLTSGVAHEINNPTSFTYASVYMMKDEISAIKTFLTELAGGDKADPQVLQSFDDKFARLIELTDTATEGTKRIKTIVNNLRTFSRLDSAEHKTTTITDLIISTVDLVRTQYDDITITTQFYDEPLLNCYPSRLAQVFMNLTVNACQAIEINKLQQASLKSVKGEVNITTKKVNQQLHICFSDNGCGMDEKTQQRIFEPFFTTKDVGSGTGLGMAISFGIIEEHHGRFEINSIAGQGTSITVCLPIS